MGSVEAAVGFAGLERTPKVTQQDPQPPGYQQPPQPSQQPPAGQPLVQPTQGQLTGPLPRASFGQRFGAFAIDLIIIVGAEIIISLVFGAVIAAVANAGSGAAIALASVVGLLAFILYIAIPIVYFGYMEGQPSGQTFGKRALGIRVVDFNTGGRLTMGSAMVRSVVRSVLSGIFLLGYLWMLWDPQQQTWHDKLVGTTVVPVSSHPV